MSKRTQDALENVVNTLPKCIMAGTVLCCQGLSDSNATLLAAALPKSAITTLLLPANRLSPDGIRKIGIALTRTRINRISLSNSGITDSLLDVLSNYLPRSRLTAIDASNNQLSNIDHLSATLSNTQIEELDLSYNRLQYADAKALLGALPKTKLTWVNLEGNVAINDDLRSEVTSLADSLKADRFPKGITNTSWIEREDQRTYIKNKSPPFSLK